MDNNAKAVIAFAVAVGVGALVSVPALAQTPSAGASPAPSPAASPAPSPTPTPATSLTGYATALYNQATNSSPNALYFYQPATGTYLGPSRVFDYQNETVMPNALNVQYVKNGIIGGELELTGGTNADVIKSYPMNVAEPTSGTDVTQFFVDYNNGPWLAKVGKFETLAGAEVIEDPGDANLSRSILFGYAIPFTHTGVRATYSPTALWTFNLGANNGWDNIKGNGLGTPTLEAGVAYNGPIIQATVDTYQGTERVSNAAWTTVGNSPTGKRSLVDAVVTYKVTPKLTLVGNGDVASQQNVTLVDGAGLPTGFVGTANWSGVAGYATYAFTPTVSVTARGEEFYDGGGYRTGFDQHWREATVTAAWAPGSVFIYRLEWREDNSNQAVWRTAGGANVNYVGTLAGQVVVKF